MLVWEQTQSVVFLVVLQSEPSALSWNNKTRLGNTRVNSNVLSNIFVSYQLVAISLAVSLPIRMNPQQWPNFVNLVTLQNLIKKLQNRNFTIMIVTFIASNHLSHALLWYKVTKNLKTCLKSNIPVSLLLRKLICN